MLVRGSRSGSSSSIVSEGGCGCGSSRSATFFCSASSAGVRVDDGVSAGAVEGDC